MTLKRYEEGARAEHVRHHKKNLPKIHTIAKVFRVGGEIPARLVKPMQGKMKDFELYLVQKPLKSTKCET
jgi:hypothetical protein